MRIRSKEIRRTRKRAEERLKAAVKDLRSAHPASRSTSRTAPRSTGRGSAGTSRTAAPRAAASPRPKRTAASATPPAASE